jgi:hypothetical protein
MRTVRVGRRAEFRAPCLHGAPFSPPHGGAKMVDRVKQFRSGGRICNVEIT